MVFKKVYRIYTGWTI